MKKCAFLVLLVTFFFGCETDLNKKAKLVISTESFETMLLVNVVDSKNGQLIDTEHYDLSNVVLSLTSNDTIEFDSSPYSHAQLWTDLAYEPKTSYLSKSGSFVLALSQNIPKPTESDPYRINLKVTYQESSNSLMEVSKNVTIKRSGEHLIEIYTFELDDAGDGIVVASDSTGSTSAAGEVVVPVNISVTDPTTGAPSSFNLSAGAILTTEDGYPLVGKVNTVVGLFNNQSDESESKSDGSLSSLPGNFLSSEDENLILTGAMYLDIYDEDEEGISNNHAKNVIDNTKESTSILLIIPSNTYNTEQNRYILENDSINIYHLFPGDDSWSYVKRDIVEKDEDYNVLYVQFDINYTGYWAPAFVSPGTANPSIKVTGNFTSMIFDFSISAPGYIYEFTRSVTNGEQFQLDDPIPNSMPLIIAVYEQGTSSALNKIVYEPETSGIIEDTDVFDLNVELGTYETWVFTAMGICEQSQVQVRPSGVPVYYAKYADYPDLESLSLRKYAGVTIDGSISINDIERDSTYYRFYVDYEDVQENLDMHFTTTDAEFLKFTDKIISQTTNGTNIYVEVVAPERVCDEF
ncbi:MAG: hypothetical protein JXR48_03470 [Candidatus Delongbacteria bacterium]|nr:hypothetical protein [Candidatus Delongbacteria bacterium]MBN2834006.1 hypothetical protein [Candidatus Delongbacteria bacterium]